MTEKQKIFIIVTYNIMYIQYNVHTIHTKVENILKGSLDSIPSHTVKIVGGNHCLRCKGKKLLGIVNKLENKKFVDITQQCFALLPQVNFPSNDLNFHRR